jgi:hypothetical protein
LFLAQLRAKIEALRNSARSTFISTVLEERREKERGGEEGALLFEYFLYTNFSSNPGAAIDSRRKPEGTRS